MSSRKAGQLRFDTQGVDQDPYAVEIPYSAKRSRGKTLANPEQFAKVLPIQQFSSIITLRVDSMTNEYHANSEHAWKL